MIYGIVVGSPWPLTTGVGFKLYDITDKATLYPAMTEAARAPSNDMQAFQKVLQSSKHIIAVAGAGLSAASGQHSIILCHSRLLEYEAHS